MSTPEPGDANSRSDNVTDVQRFYDRYPYPRPLDSLERYQDLWQDERKRRADFHLFWPARKYREDFTILVAGCGTSQAAKHAMQWPHAQVTGIDFSASSLRSTEDLKRHHHLDNLQLHQLSIEQAAKLNTTFDQIICTGVLHHLPDPDAGLATLRSVLKPDGAMHLMVYAPYGRAGIYMLQDFCRRLGIVPSDDTIRDLSLALKALPSAHPLKTLLNHAPDFDNEAELADALLNPQDRSYSVPQFLDFLSTAGLTFGRWTRQAPYVSRCGVVATLPQAPRIARLPLAEQYAALELFRGTMLRHSAIAYANENTARNFQIDFSGDQWLDYIPTRMTDTLCLEERLPPGAAAVLINPTHTCVDLFLPIDATQKKLFDAIDGQRTLRDIAERIVTPTSEATNLDHVRNFFEQLWWQDQIVFDTSNALTSSRRNSSLA